MAMAASACAGDRRSVGKQWLRGGDGVLIHVNAGRRFELMPIKPRGDGVPRVRTAQGRSRKADSIARAHAMSNVAKIIEISSSSPKSVEDAVKGGLEKVAHTVGNIRGAWVSEVKVRTSPVGEIKEWRVCLRVSFVVE
jgi:flavin-binding protein dodecin